MWYGCGNTSLPNPSTMRITLARDGTLTFFNGAVDIGQGSSTVLLQIAADALGLPPRRSAWWSATPTSPPMPARPRPRARPSCPAMPRGSPARTCARKILALANAGPDAKLTLDGARLSIADGEASRRSISSTCSAQALSRMSSDLAAQLRAGAIAGRTIVLEGIGTWDPPTTPLDANGQGIPYATYGFAAQMAEVEVDIGARHH